MKRARTMASMVAQLFAPRTPLSVARTAEHASSACHAVCRAGPAAPQRAAFVVNRHCSLHARSSPAFRCLSASSASETVDAEEAVNTEEAAALQPEAGVSEEIAAVAEGAVPSDEAPASSPPSRYPEFEAVWSQYEEVSVHLTRLLLKLKPLS